LKRLKVTRCQKSVLRSYSIGEGKGKRKEREKERAEGCVGVEGRWEEERFYVPESTPDTVARHRAYT